MLIAIHKWLDWQRSITEKNHFNSRSAASLRVPISSHKTPGRPAPAPGMDRLAWPARCGLGHRPGQSRGPGLASSPSAASSQPGSVQRALAQLRPLCLQPRQPAGDSVRMDDGTHGNPSGPPVGCGPGHGVRRAQLGVVFTGRSAAVGQAQAPGGRSPPSRPSLGKVAGWA